MENIQYLLKQYDAYTNIRKDLLNGDLYICTGNKHVNKAVIFNNMRVSALEELDRVLCSLKKDIKDEVTKL